MTADLLASVADLFARVETRRHAAAVVTGPQIRLEMKNCWSLAQNAGHADPWRLQHFFNDAKWDDDALRERGAAAAWKHPVHRSERVLVFDEMGDLKKGEHTLGVQRQYTGTAGRRRRLRRIPRGRAVLVGIDRSE